MSAAAGTLLSSWLQRAGQPPPVIRPWNGQRLGPEVLRVSMPLGVSVGLCAMSLATTPRQIGFASEWTLFQTGFQGFHLGSSGGRLTVTLAGAGLALTATTPLSFANAMRTFYSFVHRPRVETQRGLVIQHYFVSKLRFDADVAPVFGPPLFVPARRTVWWIAGKLRALQSGDLNFHLALIGALLIVIPTPTLR